MRRIVTSLFALCVPAVSLQAKDAGPRPAASACQALAPSSGPVPRKLCGGGGVPRGRSEGFLAQGPILVQESLAAKQVCSTSVPTIATLAPFGTLVPATTTAFPADFELIPTDAVHVYSIAGSNVLSRYGETGANTPLPSISPALPAAHDFTDMATDPATGTVYAASSQCGTMSLLHTVDVTTGARSQIGIVTNAPCLIGIAFDGAGNLVGYDVASDVWLRIDKATGAGTVVGPIGFDANFGQALDFDAATGTMYMFAFNVTAFRAELRTVNLATGASTFVAEIGDTSPGGTVQIAGAVFGSITGCPAITLSPATLPGGTTGAAYGGTITASGGTAPYGYAVTTGSLPAGLSLDGVTGVLSGTPSAAGTSNFVVTATDANACTGLQTYAITIDCATIAVTPATLPDGVAGLLYLQTVRASGGAAPYTYAVTAGSLPAGLALDAASGIVSGSPATAGSSAFTVTATDADACTGARSYAIDVAPAVDFVLGEGLGTNGVNGNRVRVYRRDTTATAVDFQAYGAANWGTNVAAADVDGAVYAEILTGPGPGDVYGPHVRGFARSGSPIAKIGFFAYGTLKFGTNVAGGDVDADGFAEILSGAGPGAVFGPHVRGFDYDNATLAPLAKVNYFAYGTLRYGAVVAAGDVDGDGFLEILTGPGPSASFNSNVRGWNVDGGTATLMTKINFVAHGTLVCGVNVAAGDVDGDGYAEMATAPGPASGNASAFLGWHYDGSAITPASGFDVTPWTNTTFGGRVGLADVDSDGRLDLLCGRGRDPLADSEGRRYDYDGAALTQRGAVFPFSTAGYGFGVNIAGGALGHY